MRSGRSLAMTLALTAAVLCGAFTDQAQARVFVGVGIGVPYVYGPPVVVAPPAYYAPYYAPAPYYNPGGTFSYAPPQPVAPQSLAPAGHGARSCRAGQYVCPLPEAAAPGAPCDCATRDGGLVPGRAR